MKFPSLYEATESFRKFMADHGCITHDQIVPTKETNYLHAVGDKPNDKKIAYTFHYDQNISGGFIRYNVDDAWRNWCYFKDPNLIEMTDQEKTDQKRQIEEANKKQKEQKLALEAEKREKLQIATKAYEEGQAVPDSFPYFQNKKLPISQATFFKGFEPRLCYDPFFKEEAVYIPFFKYNILDFRQVLSGFERVFKDGSKRTIGYKNGAASFIDAPFKTTQMKDAYYVAEGFSTALAIHLATGKGVISVNGQGNLKKYRTHGIFERNEAKFATIIASDDDKYPDKDGKITNPGQQAAREAAGINVFKLAKPYFPEELETWASQQTPPIKLTDFADVFKYLGKEETKNQLLKAEAVKMTDTPKQEVIPAELSQIDNMIPVNYPENLLDLEEDKKLAKNILRFRQVQNLLSYFGFRVFTSQFGDKFIEVLKDRFGFYIILRMEEKGLKELKDFLKTSYLIASRETDFLSDTSLDQILSRLRDDARKLELEIYNRVAKVENEYYLNCSEKNIRKAIKITKNEITTTNTPPVIFVPSLSCKPLINPDLSATLEDLKPFKDLCKISEEDFWYMVTFIIDCWMPESPYQFLMILGEQGTSKSTLQRMLVSIIDPNSVPIVKLKQDEIRVPMIVSTKRHLLSYDNESELKGEMQDTWCTITTGGGDEARGLYTNSDVHSIITKSPIIANGLYDFANRPDLKSRTIQITTTIKEDINEPNSRGFSSEIEEKWEFLKPKTMGALLKLFSLVIGIVEDLKGSFPALTRQAEYVRLLEAVRIATNQPKDLVQNFIKKGEENTLNMLVENQISCAIMYLVDEFYERTRIDTYEITFNELVDKIKFMFSSDKRIQEKPNSWFGQQLTRLTSDLRKLGYEIQKKLSSNGSKDKHRRIIKVKKLNVSDRILNEKNLKEYLGF